MYNIVIVDDEPWAREVVKALGEWEKQQINVIGEAEDGTEALRLINEHKPHIVITDMRMPGLEGVELLKELNDRFPTIKIIVMSGYDDYIYLRQAIRSRAIEYLLKPIDPNELNAALAQCVLELDQARAVETTSLVFMESGILDTYLAYRRQIYGALTDLNLVVAVQFLEKLKVFLETGVPEVQDNSMLNKISHDFILLLEEFISENEVGIDALWKNGTHEKTVSVYWNSLSDVIMDIEQWFTQAIEAIITYRKNRNRLDLTEVQNYIDRHFQEAISLESIAQHFFISKEHLSRSFKSFYSENVSDYIVRKRMEKARELLLEQGFAIKHAAQMTGFDNLAYFYKVFKKHFGYTPGDLRKEE